MKIKTLMNKARHTALVAAAALTALMPAACTSQPDEALTQQGPDTHKRMGAPTLGAFPTFDQRGAESRAVPGGFSDNTYNTPAQQKSAWEVGDSVLVEYYFTTYQKANEGASGTEQYDTGLYTTYTVVAVAADGTPTLAISGGAWMLKYKYDGNWTIYDYSLTPIPAAEMAAGVPVPETVPSGTYNAWAWYAPGSAWTAMDGRSNEPILASDLPGWDSSKPLKMWPLAITAANVGKGCRAFTNASDIPIGTAPTFSNSWYLYGSRLRIHALPGDEVTLSEDFYPTNSTGSLNDNPRPKHWADAEGTTRVEAPSSVTATADANGNAWFYGYWDSDVTLKVTLKSKTLTGDQQQEVFQTTTTTAYTHGKTYAIDAIAPMGVFLGTSTELFAMKDDGSFDKAKLCNSAKAADKWMVTDAGTLDVDNEIKTALKLVADGTGIDLVLPNVTGIADGDESSEGINSAFYGCTALHSVSLPKAETIGEGAFFQCTALTKVDASAANNIGTGAFNSCTALTKVDVSAANNIGASAFQYCSNLSSVDVSAANNIGANAFYGCKALTTVYASAANNIGGYAFYGCTTLATVDASAATTIGDYAFYGCLLLKNITLGTVTSTGYYIFDNIDNLANQTTLSIGKGTTAGTISGNTWTTFNNETWTFQFLIEWFLE